MTDILLEIERVLADRKTADPERSYVAGLYAGGVESILQKIDEEAAEAVTAARGGDSEEIVHEIADLWFHSMVLLTYRGIKIEDVMNELRRRFGVSGLDEKASR